MVAKDGWLKAAMTEDTMVAELLLRIKQGHAPAPIKTAAVAAVDLPPPRWGLRYPRSRLAFTCSPIKGVDYRRNSPKTPLSWTTGTTSSSGTTDGFDDTDLPGCGSSRSKRIASNDECVSPATIKSRRRRKQSFEEEVMVVATKRTTTQLVEEEEMMIVKNACFSDEQRAGRNESLIIKKMKLDSGGACTADKYSTTFNNTLSLPEVLSSQVLLNKKKKQQQEENGYVMLPDLNLMPNGEDYSEEFHA